MTKSKLTLFLSLLLCGTVLAACGGDAPAFSAPETSAETPPGTTSPETSESTAEPAVEPEPVPHLLLTHDLLTDTTIVLDLDTCGDWSDPKVPEIVWSFKPSGDSPFGTYTRRVCSTDAKYRYSPVYDRYVIIGVSSAGWAGIIDYATKDILWEVRLAGIGPHSIEMLPNGDVAVVGSNGDGCVKYYPVSCGMKNESDSVALKSAHGICWDPELERLIVLYYSGIKVYSVDGYGTENAKLVLDETRGAEFFSDKSGHDLSPVWGEKSLYWCTGASNVWQYDAVKNSFSSVFDRNTYIRSSRVKGLAQFTDGLVVITEALNGSITPTQDYSTRNLRVIPPVTRKRYEITCPELEFYKVRPLIAGYN